MLPNVQAAFSQNVFIKEGKMARLKSRLKKWDLDAVIKGNWEQWLSVGRYREEGIRTQIAVVGAWGRKTNLLWLGRWKGDNYGQ
jgi:hypothetical protein